MKRNEIVPMNKSEKGYFQDGFSVLESKEMSEIQGGDRNNGTCSGNATCNRNGICSGNGGRCVGNDNCVTKAVVTPIDLNRDPSFLVPGFKL